MSTILQNHYVLAVHDVRRSADFYVRMLGFDVVAEPPGWVTELAEQRRALDLISGFVDTQQLGELKAEGHDYDKAIKATGLKNDPNNRPPSTSPTNPPADILNAGITRPDDPTRKSDPRFQSSGSQLGYNPLNAFDQQMAVYQTTISQSEDLASQAILKAVPQCGGQAPPAPPASPVPAASP